jgi:hypothetical protein
VKMTSRRARTGSRVPRRRDPPCGGGSPGITDLLAARSRALVRASRRGGRTRVACPASRDRRSLVEPPGMEPGDVVSRAARDGGYDRKQFALPEEAGGTNGGTVTPHNLSQPVSAHHHPP